MVQLIAPNGVRTVYSDERGRFEFPRMRPGSHLLRIAKPREFEPDWRDSIRINGASYLGDIVLNRSSKTEAFRRLQKSHLTSVAPNCCGIFPVRRKRKRSFEGPAVPAAIPLSHTLKRQFASKNKIGSEQRSGQNIVGGFKCESSRNIY